MADLAANFSLGKLQMPWVSRSSPNFLIPAPSLELCKKNLIGRSQPCWTGLFEQPAKARTENKIET